MAGDGKDHVWYMHTEVTGDVRHHVFLSPGTFCSGSRQLLSLTAAGQRQVTPVHHRQSSEMNINMNEGAAQPAGKTGSRRKRAGTKIWTELKEKRETKETKPIWRVWIHSPRWRKNRRRGAKSGGINGEKQTAAGKLTPLITSQHWPVLEVTFKVRTSFCLF